MKTFSLIALGSALFMSAYGQQNTDPSRGPFNIMPNGVVDGVVIKDEVPLRTKVEYEPVRSSDMVWSKRVFSRIDKREKMNHDIFFPLDYIPDGKTYSNQWEPPKC